jgi:hypothetical protein
MSPKTSVGEWCEAKLDPSAFLDQADREEAAIATSATVRRRRVEAGNKLFRPSDQASALLIALNFLSRDDIAVLIVVIIREIAGESINIVADIIARMDPVQNDLKAFNLTTLIL